MPKYNIFSTKTAAQINLNPLSEKELQAYENDPYWKGNFQVKEIKETPNAKTPKGAKKIVEKEQST